MYNSQFITPIVLRAKRVIDIFISLLLITILLPLFVVLYLLIRLTSRGPAIYCQRRVGKISPGNIECFTMYKFRTMVINAESKTGAVWASKNDNRLTPIGKLLRKTRLDELPQLFNVIKGEMSLIGPRPERPEIAFKLNRTIPFYMERTYQVLPGITGLAQVYQGYDKDINDVKSKILYDFSYALSLTRPTKWLAMEINIIFRTLMIMMLGRGQ